jgi:hypothetical protein
LGFTFGSFVLRRSAAGVDGTAIGADVIAALAHLVKAAAQGDAVAQFRVGERY